MCLTVFMKRIGAMYVLKSAAVFLILSYASMTDIRKREFSLKYQIMLLMLVPIMFRAEYMWGTVIAVPFFVACLVSEGMGGGDWKAVALLGLLCGFYITLLGVFVGCVVFIIYGALSKRIKGKQAFPFIPFLTLGYIFAKILEVVLN